MPEHTLNTSTELIAKDIAYIQKDIGEIKASVKDLTGVYITKIQFDDQQKVIDARVQALERSSNLWKWLNPMISAAFSSGVTFLLINYLQSAK